MKIIITERQSKLLRRVIKENEDEEIDFYWYCRDWNNINKYKPLEFPSFGTLKDEIEIYNGKPYKAGKTYFSDPDYLAGLPYCEMEEEISNYYINHIKNGLSFGYIINIPDGNSLTPEEKDTLEAQVTQVNLFYHLMVVMLK